MTEFQEKIFELIIDENNQEIMYERLTMIYNWPEISFYDEDNDTSDCQSLGTENCSIIDLTDSYVELTCGDDYQEPHLIRIQLLSGELSVTSCEQHEFLSGMEYDEIIEELNS